MLVPAPLPSSYMEWPSPSSPTETHSLDSFRSKLKTFLFPNRPCLPFRAAVFIRLVSVRCPFLSILNPSRLCSLPVFKCLHPSRLCSLPVFKLCIVSMLVSVRVPVCVCARARVCLYACVRVCVRACLCACVRARARAKESIFLCAHACIVSADKILCFINTITTATTTTTNNNNDNKACTAPNPIGTGQLKARWRYGVGEWKLKELLV